MASLSSAEQVAAKQLLEREEQIRMEYKTKILDNENASKIQLQKELNDLKIAMEKQSTVSIAISNFVWNIVKKEGRTCLFG